MEGRLWRIQDGGQGGTISTLPTYRQVAYLPGGAPGLHEPMDEPVGEVYNNVLCWSGFHSLVVDIIPASPLAGGHVPGTDLSY